MATQRIESGRAQIAGPGGGVPMRQIEQPGVSYVAGQAQAQTSSALAQVLDRMSMVLQEEAGRQAVQEAKVDYFTKFRPDDSQVGLAAVQLTDPTSSKPAMEPLARDVRLQGGGAYVQTLRKLRSLDIAGRFEVHADNEFQKTLADIEANRITPKQAADKMANVVTGFSRAIGTMDGEAAAKFQNTMGMRASVIMGKAFELETKRQREVDTAELRLALDNDMARLPTILDQVSYVNAAGETKPVTDHVELTIKNIYQRVTPRLGLAEAERMVTEYRAKAREALIGVISAHVGDLAFAPDAVSAIAKLDKNDAGKMTPLWANLPFEDKAKIRSNLRTMQIERQTTKDQADKDTLQADTVRVAQLQSDFFRTGNRAALDELRGISIRNPKAITPEAVFDLPAKRQQGELANPRAEFVLKTEIMQGMHTSPAALEARAKQLGIGYKRLSESILPFFITKDNEEERDVEKMFRTASKIVPGQFNISQKQNEAYASMTSRFEREYVAQTQAARQAGKPLPSRKQVAQQIIGARQQSAQNGIIENNLRSLNEQFGVNGTVRKTGIVFTDETDINDIAARATALGLKSEDVTAIRQRIGIINNARKALDSE